MAAGPQDDDRIAQLAAGLERLERRLDELAAQTQAVFTEVAAARADIGVGFTEAGAREQDLTVRLDATHRLLARTYERQEDWPRLLAQLRAEPDYEAAWEDTPLVTVRIATFNNAEELVERALASVLRQTYPNWEAVVVGDCCTDDTAERIEAIGDPRIRFENLPERGAYPQDPEANWRVAGVPPGNRGLELARGAWIAVLDHDDEYTDDHIEVLLDHARRTHAELVYGRWWVVDANAGRRLAGSFGGAYSPAVGRFGWGSALCHHGLARFRYDLNAQFLLEPADAQLIRRVWEAGARFAAVDRPVATYFFKPRTPSAQAALDRMVAERGYAD